MGRAQISDLKVPMLQTLPDMPGMVRIRQRGEYLDSIEGNAEETARDRGPLKQEPWTFSTDEQSMTQSSNPSTGRTRVAGERRAAASFGPCARLESHDELQTLWGFPRRSQTEDIAEYQSFNRNHGSSSLTAKPPYLYPSPLAKEAPDGRLRRGVQPSVLTRVAPRRLVHPSILRGAGAGVVVLSARELGATMLANHRFFPLDDQLTDERNHEARGPLLHAIHEAGRYLTRGAAAAAVAAAPSDSSYDDDEPPSPTASPPPRPVRFEPLYVEDAWFLEVNPSEPTSEAQRPGRRCSRPACASCCRRARCRKPPRRSWRGASGASTNAARRRPGARRRLRMCRRRAAAGRRDGKVLGL